MPAKAIDRPQLKTEALTLRALSKRFGGVQALEDVSLSVREGEIHGLVGENGAGKSTLLAIAARALAQDAGTVSIGGVEQSHVDPARARNAGLSIVFQEPALVPDLTVAENIRLGVVRDLRPSWSDLNSWAQQQLSLMGGMHSIDPRTPVRELNPRARFVVEISKALASQPKVLLLDEPTEHLGRSDVETLFERIHEVSRSGTSVVYISHRIADVRSIAGPITVLRNGRVSGCVDSTSVSDAELIDLIVGRSLLAAMPDKREVALGDAPVLEASGLTSRWFENVSLQVRPGEVLGLAGIDGNGQREVLRSLAGLLPAKGDLRVLGNTQALGSPVRLLRAGIGYLSNDRGSEGIFSALSVKENLTAQVLHHVSRRGGWLSVPRESKESQRWIAGFAIKAPSDATEVNDLSGGNQQKVALGKVLASNPAVVLADEPTQGVDVGARFEIYSILNDQVERGAAVIMVSSDASELASFCDRVLVFSSGQVTKELGPGELNERSVTETCLTASSGRDHSRHSQGRILSFLSRSDLMPSALVASLTVLALLVSSSRNEFFFSPTNMSSLLSLFAIAAFVALGQQMVMLTGGIDLSVGPFMGLVVVIGSFQLADGTTVLQNMLGWILIVTCAVSLGVVNWLFVSRFQISPMVATLVSYTIVQGISLWLRPIPAGVVATPIVDALGRKVGDIPIAALFVGVIAVLTEVGLYRTAWGQRLRAAGSRPMVARSVGVNVDRTLLLAYVLCSLFAAAAGLLLMAQVGAGDPASGNGFTLASIAAVALGGAALAGGRGSFVGAIAGALMIQTVSTIVTFFQFSADLQRWSLGVLTLVAVSGYSVMRKHGQVGDFRDVN